MRGFVSHPRRQKCYVFGEEEHTRATQDGRHKRIPQRACAHGNNCYIQCTTYQPQGFQLQLITFSVTLTTSVIQQPQTINLIKLIVLEQGSYLLSLYLGWSL